MDALMRSGRARAATVIAALFSLSSSLFAGEVILPPIVEETVDEIVVVQGAAERHGKIFFFRNGKILDDRVLIPERMLFYTSADGFTVEWDDFAMGPAFRRVTAAKISYGLPPKRAATPPGEPEDPRQAWWGQDVNMCRLKRP